MFVVVLVALKRAVLLALRRAVWTVVTSRRTRTVVVASSVVDVGRVVGILPSLVVENHCRKSPSVEYVL